MSCEPTSHLVKMLYSWQVTGKIFYFVNGRLASSDAGKIANKKSEKCRKEGSTYALTLNWQNKYSVWLYHRVLRNKIPGETHFSRAVG